MVEYRKVWRGNLVECAPSPAKPQAASKVIVLDEAENRREGIITRTKNSTPAKPYRIRELHVEISPIPSVIILRYLASK